MIETTKYTLQVGDKIIQTHVFGRNIFTIKKVTKTQAIHYNENGYAIRFGRECVISSNGHVHIINIPRIPWNSSTYEIIKNDK